MSRLRLGVLPEAYTLVRVAFDERTPRRATALVLALVAYLLVPLDVLPDVVLGVGWLDDLTLGVVVHRLVLRSVPPDVVADHRAVARENAVTAGAVLLVAVVAALTVTLLAAWRLGVV
ncbi:YkvA family protein [Halomarina salina]|uniref:YkvA family protein n=1 Tax=Halomarina salina TaxID=1872699 RepID=A0ABD5RKQ9_9EURY|nr:DUF1232 domain-containing protein [Halomarina salina]